MTPVDQDQARRDRLVRHIEGTRCVKERRVLEALRAVPRHLFFAADSPDDAYADAPRPIGLGQTISQPCVVGMMSEALELSGEERVLEIGGGCGYQAAVLSLLCSHVDSIELLPELALPARERLARLGYANVTMRVGDGYLGWPEHAPFARILLSAAPAKIPEELVRQLADGGILVAPVGTTHQRVVRLRRRGAELITEDLGPIVFVPLVHGDAARDG